MIATSIRVSELKKEEKENIHNAYKLAKEAPNWRDIEVATTKSGFTQEAFYNNSVRLYERLLEATEAALRMLENKQRVSLRQGIRRRRKKGKNSG